MMSLNDNEKDFQKKLQEETEIPVIMKICPSYDDICKSSVLSNSV